MTTRKLIAFIILGVTMLFPFRFAFLDQPDHGPKDLLNFLLVMAGAAIFALLLSSDGSKKTAVTTHTAHENNHKQAA